MIKYTTIKDSKLKEKSIIQEPEPETNRGHVHGRIVDFLKDKGKNRLVQLITMDFCN